MEFTEVIKNRYSCKKFSDRQVEKEALDAILEAGRLAPTAKNSQPQHVYVLQSKEALARIDELTICRYNAPTVLVVTYDKNNIFHYPGDRYDSGAEDATIVATHMILAAENAGVDSCWINRLDPDEMGRVLGLPENEVVVMILDLGYRAEDGEPLANHFSRKALSETVTYM